MQPATEHALTTFHSLLFRMFTLFFFKKKMSSPCHFYFFYFRAWPLRHHHAKCFRASIMLTDLQPAGPCPLSTVKIGCVLSCFICDGHAFGNGGILNYPCTRPHPGSALTSFLPAGICFLSLYVLPPMLPLLRDVCVHYVGIDMDRASCYVRIPGCDHVTLGAGTLSAPAYRHPYPAFT